MRILVLTPWYPDQHRPNHGLFVREQALALADHHKVMIISSKIDYSAKRFFFFRTKETNFKSINERRLVIGQSLPIYNQLNFFLITIWHTWRVGRKFRPDIIHGHVGYPTAFWCWVVSRILRKPYVVTEHTRLKNNFRSFLHEKLTLFGLRHASRVVAVSHFLSAEMISAVSRPVEVIPNVVNVFKFQNSGPSPKDIPQLGFLGGLGTPVKGLDILLKAMALLQRPFVLHIGGDGALMDHYKDMAYRLGMEKSCKFYGPIVPDDVPLFMSKLHFFVCSSRYETFGVAVVEALASGLPVVSTQCGGPEDFVSTKTGILAAVEDVNDLFLKIEWMISNRVRFEDRELRKQASGYSGDAVVRLLDAVYNSLVTPSL